MVHIIQHRKLKIERNLLKPECKISCSGMVNSSCTTSGTCPVTLAKINVREGAFKNGGFRDTGNIFLKTQNICDKNL